MAHSDMNTEAKTIKVSNMNHVEGGWPEHVRTEMIEHKNKFIRQTCKEDMFKWLVGEEEKYLCLFHSVQDSDRADQEGGDSPEAEQHHEHRGDLLR